MIAYYGYNANLPQIAPEFELVPVIREEVTPIIIDSSEIIAQEVPIISNFQISSEVTQNQLDPVISIEAISKSLDFVENSKDNEKTESKFAHLFQKEEKSNCKFTTYSDLFEDFNNTDDYSNWDISNSDVFDIGDKGFPQPLPTSDAGTIFDKFGREEIVEVQLENNIAPQSSDCILPDPIDLIPPVIKKDLIINPEKDWDNSLSNLSLKEQFDYVQRF